MIPVPVIETERLRLRPLALSDASELCRLAGDPGVALQTLHIPYPFEQAAAEKWLAGVAERIDRGEEMVWGFETRAGKSLIGAIGLRGISTEHRHAELAGWIGRPFWTKSFATEASAAVLLYGFSTLGLHRIYGYHFISNPASGKVMRKLGMSHEGRLRQHFRRDGRFEDLEVYGILREEFAGRS